MTIIYSRLTFSDVWYIKVYTTTSIVLKEKNINSPLEVDLELQSFDPTREEKCINVIIAEYANIKTNIIALKILKY